MTSQGFAEPIIEPHLPIIDAHHHLWFLPEAAVIALEQQDSVVARGLAPTFRRHARYLFDEWMADINSGHNVRASVFIDAHAMYRASGPDAMRSVGEIEFVNGVAAMADSGLFGSVRACAGIVGGVDLAPGEAAVEPISKRICAPVAVGPRHSQPRSDDDDARILGQGVGVPHVLRDTKFRSAFARLPGWELSFDALILEPQLPDLIDLPADPDVPIIFESPGHSHRCWPVRRAERGALCAVESEHPYFVGLLERERQAGGIGDAVWRVHIVSGEPAGDIGGTGGGMAPLH